MQFEGPKMFAGRSHRLRKEIDSHHAIEIPRNLYFGLFMKQIICCTFLKRNKLNRIFQQGVDRFNSDTDIISLVRNLRKHEIALKSSILCCDEKQILTEHADINVLNFDSDDLLEKEEPTNKQMEYSNN